MFNINQPLSEQMVDIPTELSPYVVVVGSVSRGKLNPKDLDLIYGDSDKDLKRIVDIIDKYDFVFDSSITGHWHFRDTTEEGTQLVEILPFHYGKSYRSCRRAGTEYDICGVRLIVAPASYSQSKDDYERSRRAT